MRCVMCDIKEIKNTEKYDKIRKSSKFKTAGF